MLIKVKIDTQTRGQVLETVQLFRAKVVDVATDAITIEATGDSGKLNAMLAVLEPFGIREIVQSGPGGHRPRLALHHRPHPARRSRHGRSLTATTALKKEIPVAELFYDDDADLSLIQGKNVAVIGYGSQGHAHALNLRDSGVDVRVGLKEGSKSMAKAEAEGLRVLAGRRGGRGGRRHRHPRARPVPAASSTPSRSSRTSPRATPSSSATASTSASATSSRRPASTSSWSPRRRRATPCVASSSPAVASRTSSPSSRTRPGKAWDLAKSYAKAIGGTRAGVIKTTFTEETETDLFGEQSVLCGGVSHLVQAGFETLVEAGYQPEIAYFECLHELKLIVDLMWEGGIAKSGGASPTPPSTATTSRARASSTPGSRSA